MKWYIKKHPQSGRWYAYERKRGGPDYYGPYKTLWQAMCAAFGKQGYGGQGGNGMKIKKQKDGNISIILSTDEVFNLLEISRYAHEAGYFEEKSQEYERNIIEFFNELADVL